LLIETTSSSQTPCQESLAGTTPPVTPEPDFFLRTHGDIPELDCTTYRLTVAGLVGKPYRFSLKELRQEFPVQETTATLQCAGNRRCSASAIKAVPNEVRWGDDAISNAVWTGCSLAKVLSFVGFPGHAKHVEFIGTDLCQKEGTETRFGGSIPLARALLGDVLLAACMQFGTQNALGFRSWSWPKVR
jgi:sulfite oxidase